MFRWFVALCLLLGALQSSDAPTVNRVFVRTLYNASIIFEYANAAIPEGRPATPASVECLTSRLRATGLFTDIQVILKPVDGEAKINVDILPIWNDLKDGFLIKEITIDGFAALDEKQLIRKLEQKGLKVGVPVLQYPLPAIRKMALDSIREIYQYDSKRMNDAEEELSTLSFRLDLVDSTSIRLRLTTADTPLCQ